MTRGGKVVYAGIKAGAGAAAGPGAAARDLGGATLLPGFQDSHGHLLLAAHSLLNAQLAPVKVCGPVGGRVLQATESAQPPASSWPFPHAHAPTPTPARPCPHTPTPVGQYGGTAPQRNAVTVPPRQLQATRPSCNTSMPSLRPSFSPAQSIDGIVQAMRAHAAGVPEGIWVEGGGFRYHELKEKRWPTRDDLDKARAAKGQGVLPGCSAAG